MSKALHLFHFIPLPVAHLADTIPLLKAIEESRFNHLMSIYNIIINGLREVGELKAETKFLFLFLFLFFSPSSKRLQLNEHIILVILCKEGLLNRAIK